MNLFRRIIRLIILGFIVPILLLVLLSNIGIQEDLYKIIETLVLAYMYMALLATIFNRIPKSPKFKRNITLYHWMDDLSDFDERMFYLLKKNKIKFSTIENLTSIKETFMKMTNRNKEKLKLYKVLYTQYSKETPEEMYLKTVIAFLIPFIILILRDYVPKIGDFGTYSTILLMMLMFITIAFIFDRVNIDKKRNGIILGLLDLCIEEIEKEESKKKDDSV